MCGFGASCSTLKLDENTEIPYVLHRHSTSIQKSVLKGDGDGDGDDDSSKVSGAAVAAVAYTCLVLCKVITALLYNCWRR